MSLIEQTRSPFSFAEMKQVVGGYNPHCAAVDANGDGAVTIDEPVEAVRNALEGCPD